jgi:hypothetical protein
MTYRAALKLFAMALAWSVGLPLAAAWAQPATREQRPDHPRLR